MVARRGAMTVSQNGQAMAAPTERAGQRNQRDGRTIVAVSRQKILVTDRIFPVRQTLGSQLLNASHRFYLAAKIAQHRGF